MCLFVKYVFSLFLLGIVSAKYNNWEHCTVLDGDGKYHICWATSVSTAGLSEIVFGVDVQTHGYVGLGLSPKGGMSGSDIVTGWVKDGITYFQDRHGVGTTIPPIDSKNDWELLYGSENETHTSFVFRRKLDTCDEEDLKIDGSTMRLIYAYYNEDPSSEDYLQYHHGNRGTKSVLLLQPKLQSIDNSQLEYWDILSPSFSITSDFHTMYWCKIHKAPVLPVKNHIIMVEPLIQEGSEGFVHHMLLYECVGALPDDYDTYLDTPGHKCREPNMPDHLRRCDGNTFAWAIGGEAIVLPDNVGFPIEADASKYYVMEIHYDNPFRKNGITDNSGFRVYYTPELRKYDAGLLVFGYQVSPSLVIPPGREEYTIAGHSNPDCIDPFLSNDGIKILGVILHSHLTGHRLKARHFRKNIELKPIAVDNNYDFNYQDYRFLEKEVEFLPGDQITLECTFDTSNRKNATFGGESTSEEMCLAYVIYYPSIAVHGSTSSPKIEEFKLYLGAEAIKGDVKNIEFYKSILYYNWDSVDAKNVEKGFLSSQHDTYCILGNGKRDSVKSFASYPKNLQPFKEEYSCILNNGYIVTAELKTICLGILFLCLLSVLRNNGYKSV